MLSACETPILMDVDYSGSQLVVEGYIQQGYPAYVFLTKSEGYFDLISTNTLNDIAVEDAKVFVERDDGVIHRLTHVNSFLQDSLSLLESTGLPFNALYIDLDYREDEFSQINYRYKLIIIWGEDTISSSTSIPPPYTVDSVWVSKKDSKESDYKFYIRARINDPDTLGNSALIHFKRDVGWKPIDPLFIPCAIPVRTDNLVNGENFEALFARSGRLSGEDGVLLPFYGDRLEDGEFIRKDIVLLRLAHIDQQTYKFWRSVDRVGESSGNPFSEPLNLYTNISGGLGTWSGLGVSYYYVPIVADTVIYDRYESLDIFDIF